MQVKICPKCKAENKAENTACSKCYAPLDEVPLSEVADPVAPPPRVSTPPDQPTAPPTQVAPPTEMPKVPPVGAPTPPAAPPSMAGPSPYGPPPSAVYTPPVREFTRPTKPGPNWSGIVLLILILGGGGFAGWWFFLRPPSPAEVVQRFHAAAKAGDIEKLKDCLSAGSRPLLDTPGAAESVKKELVIAETEDGKPKIGETTFEGESTAFVKIEPPPSEQIPAGVTVGFVLIKEDGRWKIDLQQTMKRLMEQAMREMMKKGFKMPQGASPFGR